MAGITWAVEVDWDRSGSYETDITADVAMPGNGIVIDRGFDRDGVYQAASVSITVRNDDGTYSPGNSASARYGQLRPLVPIRVTATHSAVTYTLFTGYIMSFKVQGVAAGFVPTCTFECTDLAGVLGDVAPIEVAAVLAGTSDDAYTAVATAAGLAGGDYNFPTGAQTFPIHWVHAQNALEAMGEICVSELGGNWWVDALGVIQGEPRTTRTGTTVDDTWGDGTTIFPATGEVLIDKGDIITSVEVQAQITSEDEGSVVILAFSRNAANPTPDSIALTAGERYEVTVGLPSPTQSIVTPVASTDYTANASVDGTGTDMTASLGVTATLLGGAVSVELVNNHASTTLYVTKFELRGLATNIQADRPSFRASKSITGDKTTRGIQTFIPFADDSQAVQDYAIHLLRTWRYEPPRLRLVFDASNDAKRVSMLQLELGDLIKYKDTGITTKGTYSDDWYYVDRIVHNIPPSLAGQTFMTAVSLVPSYQFRQLDKIAYDDFARTNATGDLGKSFSGDTWADDGNFDIASEKARANNNAEQYPNLDLGSGATDHVVEVSLANITTSDKAGVVFRLQDGGNFYAVYVHNDDGTLELFKKVASAYTVLANPSVTPGSTPEIRAMVQGTRIRVWLNRVLEIDVTDSALSTGTKVGLYAGDATGSATFDDFYAEGL